MPTHIEVGNAGGISAFGSAQGDDDLFFSQTITPTGSNQATSFDLTGKTGPFVANITADENIFVVIGTLPDATTTPRRALTAGTTRTFKIKPGQNIAVVSR